MLDDFDRCAPRGVGAAKVGGNYAPVLRHSGAAKKAGYGITLHLDAQTREKIDEFSTSGFLAVKEENGKTTVVVPESDNIIESVTSDSLCQIARDAGYAVEKREIEWKEVIGGGFKEVCAVGTAAGLVPIRSITRGEKKVAYLEGETPGKYAVELLQKLRDVQFGRVEDAKGWRFEVTEA